MTVEWKCVPQLPFSFICGRHSIEGADSKLHFKDAVHQCPEASLLSVLEIEEKLKSQWFIIFFFIFNLSLNSVLKALKLGCDSSL